MRTRILWTAMLSALFPLLSGAAAPPPDETGYEAWLRYRPIPPCTPRRSRSFRAP